ncbi:MAG: NADH:ubiquinone oxidoreductase [Paracoccaceae bacterium]
MSDVKNLECQRNCRLAAIAIGLLAFVAMWLAAGYGFFASLVVGLILFSMFAFILPRVICGQEPEEIAVAPAFPVEAPSAEPEPAPAPTPAAAVSTPEPAPKPAPKPAQAARPAAAAASSGPELLGKPRGGVADDLKKIKGVGPKFETVLNKAGVWHFDQIASWSEADIAHVDELLEGFKGRIARDGWVEQARLLAAGGSTEFSDRVAKGDVYGGKA